MGKRRKVRDEPMVKAAREHGVTTVMRAVGYVACWSVTAESIGHEPSFEEYRQWWEMAERTAYRDQAAFRKVTGLQDPSSIWQRARAAGVELDRDTASAGGGLALLPFMHWSTS
jgi:hypothetical protein